MSSHPYTGDHTGEPCLLVGPMRPEHSPKDFVDYPDVVAIERKTCSDVWNPIPTTDWYAKLYLQPRGIDPETIAQFIRLDWAPRASSLSIAIEYPRPPKEYLCRNCWRTDHPGSDCPREVVCAACGGNHRIRSCLKLGKRQFTCPLCTTQRHHFLHGKSCPTIKDMSRWYYQTYCKVI